MHKTFLIGDFFIMLSLGHLTKHNVPHLLVLQKQWNNYNKQKHDNETPIET